MLPPDNRWDRSIRMELRDGDFPPGGEFAWGSGSEVAQVQSSQYYVYNTVRWTEFWMMFSQLGTYSGWKLYTESHLPSGGTLAPWGDEALSSSRRFRHWTGPGQWEAAYGGSSDLDMGVWHHFRIAHLNTTGSNGWYLVYRDNSLILSFNGITSAAAQNWYPKIGFYRGSASTGTDIGYIAGFQIHDSDPGYPGTGPSQPPQVTGLVATPSNQQVTLSWSNPGGIDGVSVRWSNSSAPQTVGAGTALLDDTSIPLDTGVVHSPLTNGLTYYYSVFTRSGVGNYSGPVTTLAVPGELATGPGSGTHLWDETWTYSDGNLATVGSANWAEPLWSGETGLRVISGDLAGSVSGWGGAYSLENSLGNADYVFPITTKPINGSQVLFYCIANYQGETGTGRTNTNGPSGYLINFTSQAGNDRIRLQRRVNGSATTLFDNSSYEVSNGDWLILRKDGDNYSVWIAPAGSLASAFQVGSTVNDTGFTGQTGRVAVETNDGLSRYSDFYASSLEPAGPQALEGEIQGESQLTGDLEVYDSQVLTGGVVGESQLTGDLTGGLTPTDQPLEGEIQGESQLTGFLDADATSEHVSGTVTGQSVLSGVLTPTNVTPSIPAIKQKYLDPVVYWRVLAFTNDGNFIAELTELSQRSMTLTLNGIDSASFSMTLDNPNANSILPGSTVVKIWREWDGRIINPLRPDFGGIVFPAGEDGEGNAFDLTAFSPLHLLRRRFIHEPYNPSGVPEDQSTTLWNLVNYTNGRGRTGIRQGTLVTTVDRIAVLENLTNVWAAIEELTRVDGAVEIAPTYVHLDGDDRIMEFSTAFPLGLARTDIRIDYRIGLNNATSAEREFLTEEQEFSNYVKYIGQVSDDPESAIQAFAIDSGSIDGYWLVERVERDDSIQTADLLQAKADHDIEEASTPIQSVSMRIDPTRVPRFGQHFGMGDIFPVAAKRGRMEFDAHHRVVGATLNVSDADIETAEIQLIAPGPHTHP